MARHGIVALLAAATILSVGVNAGPCRHHTRRPHHSLSSYPTSTIDTVSTPYWPSGPTPTPGITDPTIETTATETATESESETTDVEATVTESVPEATATPDPVDPEPCVETQILVNPGFNDNNDASPWTLGSGVTVSQVNPRSEPNFLYNTFSRGGATTTTFSQTLPALGSFTYQLQYYINLQTAINGRSFSCSATPSVNGQLLNPEETLTANGPYGFRLSSQTFTAQDEDSPAVLSIAISCQGDFGAIIIGADDFSLTRLCSV